MRDPSQSNLIWGMFFWHADDRAESLARIDEAIADDPGNAVAHLWRARLLVRDYLRRRMQWQQRVHIPMLFLLGGKDESERRLAELARSLKESSASLDEYQRLSEAAGAEAAFAEGVAHFLDRRHDEAAAPLQEATESTYLSRDAYLLLAIVRTLLGDWERAEEDLLKARGEKRDYLLVRSMLALHALIEIKNDGSNVAAGAAIGRHLLVLLLADSDYTKWELWTGSDERIRRDLLPYIVLARP